MLVRGGMNDMESRRAKTEVLDLTRGTSSPRPAMERARAGAAVTVLPDEGGVPVIGGEHEDATDLAATKVLGVAVQETEVLPWGEGRGGWCSGHGGTCVGTAARRSTTEVPQRRTRWGRGPTLLSTQGAGGSRHTIRRNFLLLIPTVDAKIPCLPW